MSQAAGDRDAARDCAGPRVVHTIGHSTRSIDELIALLDAHAVQCAVDVRRWPASRRFPHFRREALDASLGAAGIAYVWREDLGGYRAPSPDSPNTGWRTPAFRAYADFMLTPGFEAAIGAVERLAAERRIAVMCAEAVPWRCHRQLLADAFTVRGWPVRHIMDDGCHAHHLPPFAHPAGTRILYGGPDLFTRAGEEDRESARQSRVTSAGRPPPPSP